MKAFLVHLLCLVIGHHRFYDTEYLINSGRTKRVVTVKCMRCGAHLDKH